MLSVRAALEIVLGDVRPLGAERVGLPSALGRVLAEPMRASRDVPPFRNSAMDGFALRAADTAGASAAAPVALRLLEVVAAGSVPQREVAAGTATKIMTGSPMPTGADAVVRVEDTEEQAGVVRIHVAVQPGACIREPGEDMRAGQLVLPAGHALRPADIGLLASLGAAVVRVHRRPEVAIVSTGDELVDLGEPLGPGQIVNSNAYTLAAAVEAAGGVPRVLGIVRDTVDDLTAVFAEALTSDLVLSTGGVSMGSFDLVRTTLSGLGVEERFWKVAQRPGKPVTFGMRERVPVFGLPGNPVSSLVCFYIFVQPVLRRMLGLERVHLPTVVARLGETVQTAPGLTEFVRCTLERDGESYVARPTGSQSSGVLRSMSLGQGLLVAPPDVEVLKVGTAVRVVRLFEEGTVEPPV
jgi:molybdopterin molybdotransferase